MLQSERNWTLIESFVTLVMIRESSMHRGLHLRSCVLGGLGCPRRSGHDSFYSSPGWRSKLVCLTGVWLRMKVPGERMTDIKLEIYSLHSMVEKFSIKLNSIAKSSHIINVLWEEILATLKIAFLIKIISLNIL